MSAEVRQEIRELIKVKGRITFAEFMQICLYSPHGGFYSLRSDRINAHFGTSPTSHPAFGALIALQMEQMWHILGEPDVFHLIEVGSGDGGLARSIVTACRLTYPQFARALRYVAADYQPTKYQTSGHASDWSTGNTEAGPTSVREPQLGVQGIRAEGLRPFRNVVGCILCNELIDNFPFRRFAIDGGNTREVFVTTAGEGFAEVLDDPSSPAIEQRLGSVAPSLAEGYRGELCLALEDWTCQLARSLHRGFVLTIDYGELAADLYSPRNAEGTMVCYRRHIATSDPCQDPGQQDITCQVDFTSLMQLGERQGLSTVGFARQSAFLQNLGFSSFLEEMQSPGLSAARAEFNRTALMTLVEPEEYGDFKVLVQARGVDQGIELLGFASTEH